jgi:hypothetical protein
MVPIGKGVLVCAPVWSVGQNVFDAHIRGASSQFTCCFIHVSCFVEAMCMFVCASAWRVWLHSVVSCAHMFRTRLALLLVEKKLTMRTADLLDYMNSYPLRPENLPALDFVSAGCWSWQFRRQY